MKMQRMMIQLPASLKAKLDALRKQGTTASVGNQIALQCEMKPAREIASIIRAAHERILQELADGGGRLHASLATKKGTR